MGIKSINDFPNSGKIDIDLTGPMGNAYYLLGLVGRLNDEYNLKLDVESIIEDMKSSDYEHLLSVFDKHFGHFVNLYR